MALAGTAAKLLASLDLDTKPFEAGARRANTTLGKMEGRFAKIGSLAKKGLGNAVTNLTRLGAAAAAFVGANVFKGVESLAQLEDATTSVDGAIKQLGLTGRLTSAQVAQWANQIEAATQAAFDDKDIVQATSTLLRYGKIAPNLLKPAMTVMVDLAARTGSVASAGDALAKSLADPTKATRLLRQAGVSLTKEQTEQIKKWVEGGKLAKAQAFLLDLVAKSTKDAAAASKGPYNDALNILKDTIEDAQRALGEGFLPLIQRVSSRFSAFIAKPENIEKIRSFGRTLADAFEKVLEFGQRVPWGAIGDSMKIAGAGAKVLFDAFMGLPAWVQTAVVTGWGLNKLTGGALGGIVSELAKGLIKGVLGIQAGVVNINAGVVKGGGGGVAAGGQGMLVTALKLGGLLAVPLILAEVQKQIIDPRIQSEAGQNVSGVRGVIASGDPAKIRVALEGIKAGRDSLAGLQKVLYDLNANGVKVHTEGLISALEQGYKNAMANLPTPRRPLRVYGEVEDKRGQIDWGKIASGQEKNRQRTERVQTAVERLKATADLTRTATISAGHNDATRIITGISNAIRANRAMVTVTTIGGGSTSTVRASGATVNWRYRDRKPVPI